MSESTEMYTLSMYPDDRWIAVSVKDGNILAEGANLQEVIHNLLANVEGE